MDDTEIFFPNQNVGGAYMMISGAALTSVTQTESENEAQCRAEATKLIEFLTTPRVQEELIRKFSEYPLNPSAQISGLFASAGKGQKEVRQGTFEKRFIGASTILDLREDVLSVLDEVNFDSKHPPPAPKKAEIERDAEEAKRGDEFIHVHRDQPTETP